MHWEQSFRGPNGLHKDPRQHLRVLRDLGFQNGENYLAKEVVSTFPLDRCPQTKYQQTHILRSHNITGFFYSVSISGI
ncbi:hypothetical protein FKM82_011319 [Ascaphus truei]